MKKKRTYINYLLWEDYLNGLYDLERHYTQQETELKVEQAKSLLAYTFNFHEHALDMIHAWPIASRVQLSNRNRNRQAWIGQATCCYVLGVPERITKVAWRMLTIEEQNAANKAADDVIKVWENIP